MWYIEMGGVYNINCNDKVFGRKIYCDIEEKNSIRNRFNNTDVYATVFQYNNENQNNSDLIGPMYLDLDMDINNDEDYQKLKQDLNKIVIYLERQYGIEKDFISFFFTGKKGFHLLIPSKVFGIKPDKNLNLYYKEIAKELSSNTILPIIDLRIYDKKRLFRLPNSINGKTGLYKIPVTYEEITKLNYDEMKALASTTRELKVNNDFRVVDKAVNKINEIKNDLNKAKNKKEFIIPQNVDMSKITFPKCIKSIFNDGCSEGNRNNTTVILASALLQKGISYEVTMNMIRKWNAEKNDPSLTDTEINNTVSSAYQLINSGRRYGCASIKDMGLCKGKLCNIFK